MPLARQLSILMSLMLAALLLGNLLVTVNNAKSHFQSQLENRAFDTATSLALSMSTVIRKNDAAALNSIIDVIFDRGHYRHILYEDLNGLPIIERHSPVAIEEVPKWFISLLALETAAGIEEVSDGWQQLGRLTVISHPVSAYQDLWQITKAQFSWFVVISLLSYLSFYLLLKILLAPLQRVEEQAQAICRREFISQDNLPKTRELKRVVEAMNKMAGQLQKVFSSQVEMIEHLRDSAFRDPVTGLNNRSAFDDRLQTGLSAEHGYPQGILFLAQLANFAPYNLQQGQSAGDRLLKNFAQLWQQAFADSPMAYVARRGGANFIAFAPSMEPSQMAPLAEKLIKQSQQLTHQQSPEVILHLGMVTTQQDVRQAQDASQLLAQADMALRRAQQQQLEGGWYCLSQAQTEQARPAGDWQQLLQQHLARRSFQVHFQPVVSLADGQLLHIEALARLPLDNELISAGNYMPFVDRFQFNSLHDRLILELVCDAMDDWPGYDTRVCVNLSPRSLLDKDFINWLKEFCLSHYLFSRRLILEIPEYAVKLAEQPLRQLVEQCQLTGVQVSIDHFGSGETAFSYLQSIRVDHIKIDCSYIRNIEQHPDHQFFVESVVQIANSLDIPTYAEGIESETEHRLLSRLGVKGALGYFLQHPQSSLAELNPQGYPKGGVLNNA